MEATMSDVFRTSKTRNVDGDFVELDGRDYFRIANVDLMDEFFMSLVGPSDHWMFLSSKGALTAGRKNSDHALFPYAPDDQIVAMRSTTGPHTWIRLVDTEHAYSDTGPIWEPFGSDRKPVSWRRQHLYKSPLGNRVLFEEVHDQWDCSFQQSWSFSERFGFVRICRITNNGTKTRRMEILDGIRNILPFGIGEEFQARFSNLGNAYKRQELLESGLALYYLSSIPTDRAEPSEGLRATTVWQRGLAATATLISSGQISRFLRGEKLDSELDVRGRPGDFLRVFDLALAPGESKEWVIAADVDQSHADIVGLDEWLKDDSDRIGTVLQDIDHCETRLRNLIASADGLQQTANRRRTCRHLSNTIFNVMRGGIPVANYRFPTRDFKQHLTRLNRPAYERNRDWLAGLPEELDIAVLQDEARQREDTDLVRIANEYLPLTFGRRHGDPTRPWNRFSIDIRTESGEPNLNYQGNWRDIFQNWEALGVSFPELFPAMACRFVNATTADGYNPYRLTKDGFEWEEPAPDDPWANIGYWGDHQIIYLLKLLEWTDAFHPGLLGDLLGRKQFVHANIPYRIATADEIWRDPRDTIRFDAELAKEIQQRVAEMGNDGKLAADSAGQTMHVNLLEKLLILSLTKLSNFVPDGGIWLNTQRPEWNDANNALVGNGLSVVTTANLYRWFGFLQRLLNGQSAKWQVSSPVATFFHEVGDVFREMANRHGVGIEGPVRLDLVRRLQKIGSDYRGTVYGARENQADMELDGGELIDFCGVVNQCLERTLTNNRRGDGLYHTYNLLEFDEHQLGVRHLPEMLEGQVAILSSGFLDAAEANSLLNAVRKSRLYRANQNSYLLYPDRSLPRFLERNRIDESYIGPDSPLRRLLDAGDGSIVERDIRGAVHFHGDFRNSSDVRAAIHRLQEQFEFSESEVDSVCRLFESVFNHSEFTGRSGSMYAYEGLGSIYWHMVSKLLLAVSENVFRASEEGASRQVIDELTRHYRQIQQGIGAEKNPSEYGAFPTDPYSHTPENSGVKQPGMTGQVKEDVLSRLAELGLHVENGCLKFRTGLFDENELLAEPDEFPVVDGRGNLRQIPLPAGSLGFTICQVPVVMTRGTNRRIRIIYSDGLVRELHGLSLDRSSSRDVIDRSGKIIQLECEFS